MIHKGGARRGIVTIANLEQATDSLLRSTSKRRNLPSVTVKRNQYNIDKAILRVRPYLGRRGVCLDNVLIDGTCSYILL